MLKVSHATMTFFSGALWVAIGLFLLQMGIHLLFMPFNAAPSPTPLMNLLIQYVSYQEAAVIICTFSLYLGFLKGKHVLAKTAERSIRRIRTLPNPSPITSLFEKKYYLIIGIMFLLGFSIRYFGVPNDVRGAIDIAIGSALINGATHYFRSGFKLRIV